MLRKSMLRKVVFLLASTMIFVMVFAGCSKPASEPDDKSPTPTPADSTNGEDTDPSTEPTEEPLTRTLPLTETGETLRIAAMDYDATGKSLADNLPVFQEIEKATGVKIEWEVYSRTDYPTTMATRFAAGVDLPDMLNLSSGIDPVTSARDGLLIPLNDLIENYTLDMKLWFEKIPDVRWQHTAPDGYMYTIPMILSESMEIGKYNYLTYLVRKDWLQNLNLQVPTTMDDFYEVLMAFKEQDPNGNGQPDEIPYSQLGVAGITYLGWMYGLRIAVNDGFYTDASGEKLVYDWIDPKAKDFFTTMNRWYQEELIDPDFLTATAETYYSNILNNIAGVTSSFTMSPYFGWDAQAQATSGNPEAGWVQIPTPAGPNGEAIIESLSDVAIGHFAITKDCKNPELAIKWLDYACYSQDGINFNTYGVEGISYEVVDGSPRFLDEFANSADGLTVELSRVGASHHDQLPVISTLAEAERNYGAYFENFTYGQELYDMMKLTPKMPDSLMTPEEIEEIGTLYAPIVEYRNDMVAKFITGEASLDLFDEYVQTIKDMGIDRVLEIRQAQLNR